VSVQRVNCYLEAIFTSQLAHFFRQWLYLIDWLIDNWPIWQRQLRWPRMIFIVTDLFQDSSYGQFLHLLAIRAPRFVRFVCYTVSILSGLFYTPDSMLACIIHCKNIRISTDMLWRVFHILTQPVPYTFVSVNRWNMEKNRHKMSVDIHIFLQCSCVAMTSRYCVEMAARTISGFGTLSPPRHIIQYILKELGYLQKWQSYFPLELRPS